MTRCIREAGAVVASQRLLTSQFEEGQCGIHDLSSAGWILGHAGLDLPSISNRGYWLHARLAHLLGAGDYDQAIAFLENHLTVPGGNKLLMLACALAGRFIAERLVEVASRHPDYWFDGAFLARTSEPERLLALFDGKPVDGHAIATIGEVVIANRDAGVAEPGAEARWEAIAGRAAAPEYAADFRNVQLRLAARSDLEDAVYLLMRYGRLYPRWETYDGMLAVLGRLVMVDAARAVAIVAESSDTFDRADWFGGLCWWFNLPQEAEPLLQEMLRVGDPELNAALTRVLVSSQAPSWVDRFLSTVSAINPLDRARDFSPGIAHMQAAELAKEAEKMRERLYPWLPHDEGSNQLCARDLFDVRCAPQMPLIQPWGNGHQLP